MFELVDNLATSQRIYKFKIPLTYIPNRWDKKTPYITAKEYWTTVKNKYTTKTNDKCETIKTDALNFVCVSDAHTHIERLVFPVTTCSETNKWRITMDDIAGKYGWVTGLGETKIYDDEVYLRYLIMYNYKIKKLKGE